MSEHTTADTEKKSPEDEDEDERFSRSPDQTTPLMDSPDAPPPDKIRFGVTAKDGFEGQHRGDGGEDDITPTAYSGVDPDQVDEPARPDERKESK
jgi:hypothetical protein